ncbi:hypothetical protein JAO76_12420 [Pontibacter sp. BT310]|uniref:Uncharacterized protein n=1 Tax=Pontibacter populi TaxID=890055 RepID=A0ABS6XCX8_9BACT|nr:MULTISPECIES: hypothetical protein [Pontibacter]MBJ6119003.1 hypothetical protein [Pontibacter sp. BT310]MBR0571431.1 hypothetical protein [Microvirga sp. STS03]MBW3365857.1 hypothetical protein [Pontibacter populi]
MSFQEESIGFLEKVNAHLSPLSGKRNRKLRFDSKFKDEAIELLKASFRRRMKEPKQIISLYEEILSSGLGEYIEAHLREYVNELMIDIYLHQDCDRILRSIMGNRVLKEIAMRAPLVPGLISIGNERNYYLFSNLWDIGVPKDAKGILSIAYSIAEKIWELIQLDDTKLESQRVIMHFVKYFGTLSNVDKITCACTVLKIFNSNLIKALDDYDDRSANMVNISVVFRRLKGFLELLRNFRKLRLDDLSLIPLFDHDVKAPLVFGDKYLKQHEQFNDLLIKIEEQANISCAPLKEEEVLELLLEMIVLDKVLDKTLYEKLRKSIGSVSKCKIIETLGVDLLKEQYLKCHFFKSIIRTKYIFEVL